MPDGWRATKEDVILCSERYPPISKAKSVSERSWVCASYLQIGTEGSGNNFSSRDVEKRSVSEGGIASVFSAKES